MSIIRAPDARHAIDLDQDLTIIDLEEEGSVTFYIATGPPLGSLWPPGHIQCNPNCCNQVDYHPHHSHSHPPGHLGARPYFQYLTHYDPDRENPFETPSVLRDLQRLGTLRGNQILAIRESFRAFRAGGSSAIPQRFPDYKYSWDSSEDKENIPPLLDWNYDFRTDLYYP